MQRTEQISVERPARAVRVVPLEPSLQFRYCYIAFMSGLLILFGANIIVAFNPTLYRYSMFNAYMIYVFISLAMALFTLKPWKSLDQKRQRVARYNLATGLLARAEMPSNSRSLDMPGNLVLAVRRRRLASLLMGILFIGMLCFASVIAYTAGQMMLQTVQYGISMGIVMWEIGLNLLVVLALGYSAIHIFLVDPRQSIIATHTGLLSRRGYRTNFIPWHQARLFAIISSVPVKGQVPILFYELSSADRVIRWPSRDIFVSQGMTSKVPSDVTLLRNPFTRPAGGPAEFSQQVQLLNSIITERTGLTLYDLC